jgi:hypothetical protein
MFDLTLRFGRRGGATPTADRRGSAVLKDNRAHSLMMAARMTADICLPVAITVFPEEI